MTVPIRTEGTNVVLKLDEESHLPAEKRHDLPGERAVDPQGKPLIETAWQPDPGEQRALANGAPILLRVWGMGHPPVQVAIGEPPPGDEAVRQLPEPHVIQALGWLSAHLRGLSEDAYVASIDRTDDESGALYADNVDPLDEWFPQPPEWLELWGRALDATKDWNRPPSDEPDAEATGPGDPPPSAP